ncbi:MAG: hypothetical protein ACRDTF_25330 [Pseudonocardiaceae bacterium]
MATWAHALAAWCEGVVTLALRVAGPAVSRGKVLTMGRAGVWGLAAGGDAIKVGGWAARAGVPMRSTEACSPAELSMSLLRAARGAAHGGPALQSCP